MDWGQLLNPKPRMARDRNLRIAVVRLKRSEDQFCADAVDKYLRR
jgi:hypothetical protein